MDEAAFLVSIGRKRTPTLCWCWSLYVPPPTRSSRYRLGHFRSMEERVEARSWLVEIGSPAARAVEMPTIRDIGKAGRRRGERETHRHF